MNPADVAQSALPVAADLSIWGLFISAHWVVKSVMLGLLACSIWVWAIAIDKTVLYHWLQAGAESIFGLIALFFALWTLIEFILNRSGVYV